MVEPVDGVIKISADVRDLLVKLLREQQKVVRCKDCKYGEPVKNVLGEDRYECCLPESYVISDLALPPEWYCADGEVKEDG